jgi:hypothetical protein
MFTMSKRVGRKNGILNLGTTHSAYVTPAELAKHWRIRAEDVVASIHAGHLGALRLGARSLRIHKSEAIAFERGVAFPFAHPEPDSAANYSKGNRRLKGK